MFVLLLWVNFCAWQCIIQADACHSHPLILHVTTDSPVNSHAAVQQLLFIPELWMLCGSVKVELLLHTCSLRVLPAISCQASLLPISADVAVHIAAG